MEMELNYRFVAEFLIRLYGEDAMTVAEQLLAGKRDPEERGKWQRIVVSIYHLQKSAA